jgi:hypothetical protein
MAEYSMLAERCMVRPVFNLMQRAYGDYRTDSAPCKIPAITNQCAVRMSVALVRCGISLNAFTPRHRVHWSRPACRCNISHIVGAQELVNYLDRILGRFEKYRHRTLGDAPAGVANRRGIIFFRNCFRRERGGARVGDHIDLWDGTEYYNMKIRIGAGGDAGAAAPLFHRADQVWFLAL